MANTFLNWGRSIRLVVAVCGILGGAGQSPAAEPALSVGLRAPQNSGDVEAEWRPVLDALSQDLGRAVTPHVSKEYAEVIWALRAGKDHLAWLGNKSAMEAVDKADSEVFAREVYLGGTAGYYSVLITSASAPYPTLETLFAEAGHLTLGWGDHNSTSGFLVPGYHLFAMTGRDPSTTFYRQLSNNHEGNIMALLAGQVDAAVVGSNHLEHFVNHHPGTMEKLRVLWRSPLIPSSLLLRRKDLPEQLKSRVQAFFLGYGVDAPGKSPAQLKAEQQALAGLNIERFIASDDSQLLPVRRIELFRRRLQVNADPGLTPEERKRRLSEIEHELDLINRRMGDAGPESITARQGT